MAHHIPSQRPYARAELVADGVVHGVAIAAALLGAGFLLALSINKSGAMIAAFAVYALALLAMLGFSLAYNMWPASPVKWLLRRFDHSAIFTLIAGTYTPLLVHLQSAMQAAALAAIVWVGAILGVVVKVMFPGRFDNLSIAVYLALGWVGIFAASSFATVLPVATLVLIAVGGVLYSAGVPFYLWERLKFQNAIWHVFVVAAAACHFVAIALLYV